MGLLPYWFLLSGVAGAVGGARRLRGCLMANVSTDVSLDPADWGAFRSTAHRMVDDMIDHLAGLADDPAAVSEHSKCG